MHSSILSSKTWKAFFILAVLGGIIYANTFNNALFWDDFDSIVNNHYVHDWQYFSKFFTENLTAGSGIVSNYYRPLLLTSFAIDYSISELSPWMYHLQSLLWHILSAFFAYLLFYKLTRHYILSILGSLIFLAHPLQTEAVTYVAGRADPMHSALILGSLLSFMFFYEHPAKKKYFLFSIIFFIFGLLTKERAIILPGIITLFLAFIAEKRMLLQWPKKVKFFFPFIVLALTYLILRSTLLHFSDTFNIGQPNNTGAQGFIDSISLYFKGLALYASLLLFPAKLYMEKSISLPGSIFHPTVLIGATIFIASIWVALKNIKNHPLIPFGIFWFYGALSPSLHIFPIQGLLYEHWLYFPMIGIILVAIYSISLTSKRKQKLAMIILVIFITLLGFRSIVRNNDWHDPVRFYEKNVSLGGSSARVYTNLGLSYHAINDLDNALLNYDKALELIPDLFPPHFNKGNLYQEQGELEKAKESYKRCIESSPQFTSAYSSLAGVYIKEKQYENAINTLEEGLSLQENSQQLLYNLGIAHALNGNKPQARKYLNRILDIDPSNTDIVRMLQRL